MLSNQKPTIEKYLNPVVVYLSHVNPNILTLVGSIPPLLFFVFVIYHHFFLALIAFAGNIFDLIDGMVARKYKKVTAFGGFLDSTMDRVSDFFIITAFAFGNIVRWEIVAPFLLFSFLISYARGTSEKLALAKNDTKTKFNVGLIERTERLVLTCLALLLYMIFPTFSFSGLNIAEVIFAILVVLSCYTTLQRVIYAKKNL
jgi:archaetidylinositol phosphate synthase